MGAVTGTWNLNQPVDMVATAGYVDKQGRRFELPVGVAGDHITVQVAQRRGQESEL